MDAQSPEALETGLRRKGGLFLRSVPSAGLAIPIFLEAMSYTAQSMFPNQSSQVKGEAADNRLSILLAL